MKLSCIQRAMEKAFGHRDVGRGLYATFTWLVEEIGELGEALLKGDRKQISEEIADVIAWTLSLAAMVGIDAEEALRVKYSGELNAASCLEDNQNKETVDKKG
ncbi:MAG TPA: nucleotide pyrophosphohydrolase [Pyrodictium sp.]|nr:nucleotide pyrophosphohydrolase [Pyrodictium sp.]